MKVAIIYHTRYNSVEKVAAEIAIGIESIQNATALLIQCSEASSRIEEINSADAIVFGSPTYFGSVSSEMKTFSDFRSLCRIFF